MPARKKWFAILLDSGACIHLTHCTEAKFRRIADRHRRIRREGIARGDIVTLRRMVGIVRLKGPPKITSETVLRRRRDARP